MNIWGGWAERYCDRYFAKKAKGQLSWWRRSEWWWLHFLDIEETRANCVKFLKFTSWLGTILMTLWTAVIVLFGKD